MTILWLMCCNGIAVAQEEAELTQFMNNPLNYNPSIAGTHNAFTVDLLTRLQWVDVKDAPAIYMLNIHSPINHSKTSLGGSIISDKAGPVVINKANIAYSFLVRINHGMLLSLGISGGVSNYNVNFNKINITDQSDPLFSSSIENSFKPTVGAGVFLYTPSFYLGLSVPDMLDKTIPYKGVNINFRGQSQDFLATTGYKLFATDEISFKGSAMAKFAKNKSTYDFAVQGFYEDYFNLGGAYRVNQSAALILGVQLNRFLSVNYSYDFPINSQALKQFSSQEISISFSTEAFYTYNEYREFTRKIRKRDREVKSIRYF